MRPRKIVLPTVITQRNKYTAGLLIAAIAVSLYLSSNWFHIFEPQLLPMWDLDLAIPFVPWTVLIYLSEYLFFATVYLACRNIANLNKYFYSFLSLQSVSVMIFMLWPTTYPRDLYPLPEGLSPLVYYPFKTLRNMDTPASCCPSLHVSSVYLCSFLFLNYNKKRFSFFFNWATAIALTTLTTKQHYIIDVLVGFAMAVLFHWFFSTRVSYRPRLSLKSNPIQRY